MRFFSLRLRRFLHSAGALNIMIRYITIIRHGREAVTRQRYSRFSQLPLAEVRLLKADMMLMLVTEHCRTYADTLQEYAIATYATEALFVV